MSSEEKRREAGKRERERWREMEKFHVGLICIQDADKYLNGEARPGSGRSRRYIAAD